MPHLSSVPHPTRRQFLPLAAAAAGAVALAWGETPPPAAAAGPVDALLLNCIDYRLTSYVTQYMERRGLAQQYDHVVLAGASLAATYAGVPAWNQTFFDQVQIAVDLHSISRVIAIDHLDCGAYRAFLGADSVSTPAAEVSAHSFYLNLLREQISARYPQLGVELYLMSLDGHADDLT